MQDEEAPDLGARHHLLGRKRAVHLGDVLRQHVVDQRMAGQFLVGAVNDGIALGPVADGRKVDIEHDSRKWTSVPESDRFPDIGEELELVLDVFRRKQRAIREPSDVLRAINDLQMSGGGIDEPGIAGLDIAVRRQRFLGLGLVPEIPDEHAGRLELELATVGDPQRHIGGRGADGVGENLPVGLRRHVEKCLGLAVELLQVQAKGPVERKQLGTDRLAGRVGDAHPG